MSQSENLVTDVASHGNVAIVDPVLDVIEKVRSAGSVRDFTGWHNGGRDYVTEFALGPRDVPGLIELAGTWCKEANNYPEDNELEVYGPVHAWRALGQLRAAEAVRPLIDQMEDLELEDDDWHSCEFPIVFGMIGEPAIEPLAAYLRSESNLTYCRICAASSLAQIANRHTELRGRCVAHLKTALSHFSRNSHEFNGFLVGSLLDVKGVEAAEVLERAFVAGFVDETVAGDWGDVSKELGVEGRGLGPILPPPRRRRRRSVK